MYLSNYMYLYISIYTCIYKMYKYTNLPSLHVHGVIIQVLTKHKYHPPNYEIFSLATLSPLINSLLGESLLVGDKHENISWR